MQHLPLNCMFSYLSGNSSASTSHSGRFESSSWWNKTCYLETLPVAGFGYEIEGSLAKHQILKAECFPSRPLGIDMSQNSETDAAQACLKLKASSSSLSVTSPKLLTENSQSHQNIDDLAADALAWATLNGLVVGDRRMEGSGGSPGTGLVHVPLSLFPTPFPKILFEQAVELAVHFNGLTDAVSQDSAFLRDTLSRASKTDTFTAGLLDIHDKITVEGISQDMRLGMLRSDYMIDTATGDLLQIELNTISASFPGLSPLVTGLHRYVISKAKHDGDSPDVSSLPANDSSSALVDAIALAWTAYENESAVVLMVVQDPERNQYDQHWITVKLWEEHRVHVIRRTLAQVQAQGRLADDRSLHIGNELVSVVYFRAGYGPADYPSDLEWQARLLMERSVAIKCPTVAYHLAGAKKVQQELARPGVLERFVSDPAAVAKMRRSFAGLWSLDEDESEAIVKQAMANPEGFVLKPQREGGGNNIYGQDVKTKLQELTSSDNGNELSAYILMQRIFPPIHHSYLLREGVWHSAKTLAELGIYSTYLRNGSKVLLNRAAGHLVRTKAAESDEGGVAAGYAVLDSPYLT